MATVGLGFQLSANATQMAAGINAGVTELQKLGYAAKKTASDVSALKTVELSRAFISAANTVASSFSSIVSGAASSVASVDDLSRRTGVGAQTLMAYQYAAEQSGVSIDAFGKGIQKLGVNLGEAQTGNKAAIESFGSLGLSVQELTNLSPEAAFEAVAAAISKLPNPAQKAAAAVSVFGKSGADLVTVFSEGAGYLSEMRAEAERLGLVLSRDQVRSLATLDDTIGKVAASFKALQARVVAELAPALTQAAEASMQFMASLDVKAVAAAAQSAVSSLANVLSALASVAQPLANNTLAAIGGYIAFINREALSAGIVGLAKVFRAAATAAAGYSAAAATATAATVGLRTAVIGLASSTGVGLLVVGLGAISGAMLDVALASESAASKSAAAFNALTDQQREWLANIKDTGEQLKALQPESVNAFTVLPVINEVSLLNETAKASQQEFQKLAQDVGGINKVSEGITSEYQRLVKLLGLVNQQAVVDAGAIEEISRTATGLSAAIREVTEARKADEEASKKATAAAAEAAARASEDARRRVADLTGLSVTDGEKARLELSKDLLAINQTIVDAEKQLAAARAAGDAKAIAQAQERLRLTSDTALIAEQAAQDQARQRQLQALGIDGAILKTTNPLQSQLKGVREAFDRNLISGDEARIALKNLASEGIRIRSDIAAELAKPAQRALQATDIRTQDGVSLALSMATGREDPALEQRREQLSELRRIRAELINVGARPAEILGS